MISYIERLNDAFVEQGEPFYGQYQDYESAKWSILMLAFDHFMYKALKIRDFTQRPDNGYWDMIGYQKRPVSEPNFVGTHGGYYGFQQFKYEFDGISDRTPPYLRVSECKNACGVLKIELWWLYNALGNLASSHRENSVCF